MSKNNGKGKDKDKDKDKSKEIQSGDTTPVSSSRAGRPRGPLPPLAQRMCNTADKVYESVSDLAKTLVTRGAPKPVSDAAAAFVAEVEKWREIFFTLKNSGWEPVASNANAPIVEGDPIQILPEHIGKYAFIVGLSEGSVQLVAGSVDKISKMNTQVMLKDTEGKFYGYAPRKILDRR